MRHALLGSEGRVWLVKQPSWLTEIAVRGYEKGYVVSCIATSARVCTIVLMFIWVHQIARAHGVEVTIPYKKALVLPANTCTRSTPSLTSDDDETSSPEPESPSEKSMLSWRMWDVDVEKVRLGVNALSLASSEGLGGQSPVSFHAPCCPLPMEREEFSFACALPRSMVSGGISDPGVDLCRAIHEAAGAARPFITRPLCPSCMHTRTMLV